MDYSNPYEDKGYTEEQSGGSQDPTRVPAYPNLMSGQPGWPNMNQQQQQPQTQQPTYGSDQNSGYKQPGMTREQYRDQWMSSGTRDMAGLQNFVNQYGGQIVSGNGTVLTPSGEYIDMLIGARTNGSGMPGWTGINGGAGDPRNAGGAGSSGSGTFGAGGSGGGAFGGFGGGSFSSSSSGAFGNAKSSGLWDMLMGRATQSLNINPKDPIIAAQTNSFRAEQERAARNSLAQQAEEQGPQANLNSERRLLNERASQATGNLRSSLMQSELTARRNEIMQSLAQMGNLLTEEQRLALSRELGLLNASLDQQRITNQNNQFLDDFAFRNTQAANQWDMMRRYGS